MTIDEFINKLKFNIGEEIEEEKQARFYLKMKGIALHQQVANYLGYDLNDDKIEISWDELSSMLRYDKKIRDRLYIYIATLEEYIKAFISNKYEDNYKQEFWNNFRFVKAKDRILNGEKVSEVLSEMSLGELISQVKDMEDKTIMFTIPKDIIDTNLTAVNELRNAISHHYFLFAYNFKECIVDGKYSKGLEDNIKNLRQLLPVEYRYGINGKGGLTKDINECRYNHKNENDMLKVPGDIFLIL